MEPKLDRSDDRVSDRDICRMGCVAGDLLAMWSCFNISYMKGRPPMKARELILIFLVLLLSGCVDSRIEQNPKSFINSGVERVEDDFAICYTQYPSGISCLRKDHR